MSAFNYSQLGVESEIAVIEEQCAVGAKEISPALHGVPGEPCFGSLGQRAGWVAAKNVFSAAERRPEHLPHAAFGSESQIFNPPLRGNFASTSAVSLHFLPTTEDRRSTTADPNELWELWLAASKTAYVVDQCIATTEPAYLAKHVFQLAQMFNTFYHRYPILTEPDEQRKTFLLTTAAIVRRELIRALGVLGIKVPVVM